jgi:hypothetical protein
VFVRNGRAASQVVAQREFAAIIVDVTLAPSTGLFEKCEAT